MPSRLNDETGKGTTFKSCHKVQQRECRLPMGLTVLLSVLR